jgi:hypothetical protein
VHPLDAEARAMLLDRKNKYMYTREKTKKIYDSRSNFQEASLFVYMIFKVSV